MICDLNKNKLYTLSIDFSALPAEWEREQFSVTVRNPITFA